jgi:predicted transcriptional regulator
MKNNTKARVLRVVKSGDKNWTAREVAEKVGQKPDNVAYHLRTLTKEGAIVKVGAGLYTASPDTQVALPETVVNETISKAVSAEAITAALWSELLGMPVDSEMVSVLSRVQSVVADAMN